MASIFSQQPTLGASGTSSVYAPFISPSGIGESAGVGTKRKKLPVTGLNSFLGGNDPMRSLLQLAGPQYVDQIQQYQGGLYPTASFF